MQEFSRQIGIPERFLGKIHDSIRNNITTEEG
jgi:hypothetical protein